MRVSISPSVVEGRLEAPPSKSWAQRAIFLALLANGESVFERVPASDDVLASARAAKAFGAETSLEGKRLRIKGGSVEVPENVIDMMGSGTGARIAIGIGTLLPKGFGAVITGDESLRRRPMGPVIEIFNALGAEVKSLRGGLLPVVSFGGLPGGEAETDGSVTSQHVTSALIAGTKSENGVRIRIRRPVSRAYIALTERVLKKFGAEVACNDSYTECSVKPSNLRPVREEVPGDYALAAFPMVMAAMTGGKVVVEGLEPPDERPGDHRILKYLEKFGVYVEYSNGKVIVEGEGELKGARVNLRDEPDLALPIAALGAVAKGETVIAGISHLIHKESNRIKTIIDTLKCFGINATTDGTTIRIWGGSPKQCKVTCPNDHRVAMLAAALAAVSGGEIERAECVRKSWPEFWNVLKSLGVRTYVV